MKFIKIETRRSCYSVGQLEGTMTAGQLIELLGDYDEDTPVCFSNDKGYTYGEIYEEDIDLEIFNEDEEEE